MTRYLLVVYPPGISASERRRLRVWRGWPWWGALVWMISEIWLSHTTGPWLAFAASTAVFLASGVTAAVMAGDTRTQVHTMIATTMVGYHDPVSKAARDKLESLAEILLEADDRLQHGLISPIEHEMAWWRVYRKTATDGVTTPRWGSWTG